MAVFFAVDKFGTENPAGQNSIPKFPVETGLVPVRFQDAGRFTPRLFQGVPACLRKSRVHILDLPLAVGNDNRIGGLLNRVGEFASFFFGLHPFGDVLHRAHHQNGVILLIKSDFTLFVDNAHVAVGFDDAVFNIVRLVFV